MTTAIEEIVSYENKKSHENHHDIPQEQNKCKNLFYLEFYSGIGGWGYALEKACEQYHKKGCKNRTNDLQLVPKRLAAFDHSDLANIVLSHNDANNKLKTHELPTKPLKDIQDSRIKSKGGGNANRQKRKRNTISTYSNYSTCSTVSIEKLTANQLIDMNAHVWLMSPPCQPYSRNNVTDNRDMNDPRSKSFLHLCQLLRQIKMKSTKCLKNEESYLPFFICMENVVGFEKSDCCSIWRETLHECGYAVGHFHLSPVQVGIPNDRPRYYCVAVLKTNSDCSSSSKRIGSIEKSEKSNDIIQNLSSYMIREACFSSSPIDSNLTCYTSTSENISQPVIHTKIPELDVRNLEHQKSGLNNNENDNICSNSSEIVLPTISMFLDSDLHPPNLKDSISSSFTLNVKKLKALRIPPKLLKSDTSWCFDIVTPENSRSSCFTQAYGRFVRGTGSVLYMTNIPRSMSNQELKANIEKKIESFDSKKKVNQDVLKFALMPPDERRFDAHWAKDLDLEQHLRYFSGNEVARLMGFPIIAENNFTQMNSSLTKNKAKSSKSELIIHKDLDLVNSTPQINPCSTFSFPSHITLKQQWKLLGNSLNVSVASRIAEIGISLFLEEYNESNTR